MFDLVTLIIWLLVVSGTTAPLYSFSHNHGSVQWKMPGYLKGNDPVGDIYFHFLWPFYTGSQDVMGGYLCFPACAQDGQSGFWSGFSNLKAFRIIRITRLVKAVRLARIFRFVMAFRLLISSILHTLKSLFWALMLLVLIIYVSWCYLTPPDFEAILVLDFGGRVVPKLESIHRKNMEKYSYLF